MATTHDFTVERLGECNIKSPITMSTTHGAGLANYVTDNEFIRLNTLVEAGAGKTCRPSPNSGTCRPKGNDLF